MDRVDFLNEQLVEDGWTVDEAALAALGQDIAMTEPAMLDALLSPFRLRLMASLSRRPSSVKELGERFGVPATRLYHHLAQLEEFEAVRVVGTRRSGARTERCYGGSWGGIGLSPEILRGHPDEVGASVVKMTSLAGEAVAAAITAGRVDLEDPARSDGFLGWIGPRLTADQRRDVGAELIDLARRIGDMSERNEADQVPDTEASIVLLLATPDVLAAQPASPSDPE